MSRIWKEWMFVLVTERWKRFFVSLLFSMSCTCVCFMMKRGKNKQFSFLTQVYMSQKQSPFLSPFAFQYVSTYFLHQNTFHFAFFFFSVLFLFKDINNYTNTESNIKLIHSVLIIGKEWCTGQVKSPLAWRYHCRKKRYKISQQPMNQTKSHKGGKQFLQGMGPMTAH